MDLIMQRDVTSVVTEWGESDGQTEGRLPANCNSLHVVCNLDRHWNFHKDMENILH